VMMGVVATTLVAGVVAVREGIARPISSLTQMRDHSMGNRLEDRSREIGEFVPLASWIISSSTSETFVKDGLYAAAAKADVLERPRRLPNLSHQRHSKLQGNRRLKNESFIVPSCLQSRTSARLVCNHTAVVFCTATNPRVFRDKSDSPCLRVGLVNWSFTVKDGKRVA
jgi:hypothetical protein